MSRLEPTSPEAFPNMPAEIREQLRQQETCFAEFNATQNGEYLAASAPSVALLRANRANSKLSTGPRSLAGKEISKLNAVRHGLTGRDVLLPSEDAEAYTAHTERFRRDFSPTTERELELVQMLADTQWRINRIPNLESSIYAMGRLRHADLYFDVEPTLRNQLIDCHTLEQNAKQLNNLSIQEGRLRRQYATDLRELKALQSEREEAGKVAPALLQSSAVSTAAAVAAPANRVRFYDSAEDEADAIVSLLPSTAQARTEPAKS